MSLSDRWRKQTFWSLPVYTGDVSGVCSALYELGGMVVMHDPSGCNSTYNTHDEVRWMDMESLIFLSGLKDIDAITGNDQKLIDDITDAAEKLHPKFIAIANSPIPWLIGTDFRALCSKVFNKTGIPCFHIETNAMHDYTIGAGDAFLELAKMLFPDMAAGIYKDTERQKDSRRGRLKVNILGMTPLDFTVRSQIGSLRSLLEKAEFDVVSVWAIGDDLDTLSNAFDADVNLVVSSTGLKTAQFFEERFGIPYAAGIPAGAFCGPLLKSLRRAASSGRSEVPYLDPGLRARCPESRQETTSGSGYETEFPESEADGQDYEKFSSAPAHHTSARNEKARRCIVGEPVTMGSFAAAMAIRDGKSCDVICLTELSSGLTGNGDRCPEGEEEIRRTLSDYDEVTGDPMLEKVCRYGTRFHRLAHLAYSGRVYLDEIPALITGKENLG